MRLLSGLNERIGANSDSRFYAEVLAAVATGKRTPERIAREVDTAADDVERALHALADRGLAEQHGDEWHVVE